MKHVHALSKPLPMKCLALIDLFSCVTRCANKCQQGMSLPCIICWAKCLMPEQPPAE